MNIGISKAKGEYICFLDSDDYHLPDHLEKLHAFIQTKKDKVAFFFTNALNETQEGERSELNCPLVSRASVNEKITLNLYTYFLRYTVNPQRWCVHHSIFEKVQFLSLIHISEPTRPY